MKHLKHCKETTPILDSSLKSQTNFKNYNYKLIVMDEYIQLYRYIDETTGEVKTKLIKDKNIEKNEIKKLYELEKLGKIDYSSKIIEQYYENGNLKSRLTDIHTKETLEEYDENGKLINEECGE